MEGKIRLLSFSLWVLEHLTLGGDGKGFLDPDQLPILQVWIHGVAPTPLPLCPSQLMPQHPGAVNRALAGAQTCGAW